MQIDDYEVVGELGRGGMGVVYRARSGDREVALKLVTGNFNAQRLARFRREGEVTAALSHPGILTVHAAGESEGRPYLVYELVEGCRSLSEAFADLALRGRVALLRDAARALGHAHAMGVVHRDVKPDNLLVDRGGRVRVADFGLAAGIGLERLTQTGAVVGTPNYMAPEQFAAGKLKVGPPVDVWALGVILYEALTDDLPFPSTNLVELASQVLTCEPTPPSDIVDAVSADLQRVCLHALGRCQEGRYPNGDAFADDLDAWLEGRPVAARGRSRHRALWPPAAVAAIVAATFAVVFVSDSVPTTPATAPRAGPTPLPPAVTPNREPTAPSWFDRMPARKRPPVPLPAGLGFDAVPGIYVNAVDGSELVWVPAGTFTMGTNAIEGHPDERPTCEVTLTQGYFLGKFEVTWAQYDAYCKAARLQAPSRKIAQGTEHYTAGDRDPVFKVTLFDARGYCAWAGLRLPTEAEWERAARRPTGEGVFAWGDELPGGTRANLLGIDDGFRFVSPVGSFRDGVSPYGCFDMNGNVCEWVDTAYSRSYADWPLVDPADREGEVRVGRGGSWDVPGGRTRSTFRAKGPAERRSPRYGFRVCRSPQ